MDIIYKIFKWFIVTFSSIKITKDEIIINKHRSKARKHYKNILDNIKFGSIIGKKTDGYLTALFAGKRISHVGLYIGKFDHYQHAVIHADPREGVVIDELYMFIDNDYVEVWNYKNSYIPEEMLNIFNQCYKHLGNTYDYLFMKSNNFYCSELIVEILSNSTNTTFIEDKVLKSVRIYKPDTFISQEYFSLSYQRKVN